MKILKNHLKWPFWVQKCSNWAKISHTHVFWGYLWISKIFWKNFDFWPFFGHFSVKIMPHQRNLWNPNFAGKVYRLPGKCSNWSENAHKCCWAYLETFLMAKFWFRTPKKNYGVPKLRSGSFFGKIGENGRKTALIATLGSRNFFLKS